MSLCFSDKKELKVGYN